MARHFLVVDVESTCWENQSSTDAESEIIEVGAVLVDPGSGAVRGELQSFVRPLHRPTLSAFCMQLTSITQRDVDRSSAFPDVLRRLQTEILDRHQVLLASWGDFDREQLQRDCKRHGVKYPFGKRHEDIQRLFSDRRHCRPCSVRQALEMMHLELIGTPRRALDDARNVARILAHLL
jgi:inhibitor of KinA sporulation pathway (predicted exonuclease)